MTVKDLILNYEDFLKSKGFTADLSRYLGTFAHQALVSLDTLNQFTDVNFVVSIEIVDNSKYE